MYIVYNANSTIQLKVSLMKAYSDCKYNRSSNSEISEGLAYRFKTRQSSYFTISANDKFKVCTESGESKYLLPEEVKPGMYIPVTERQFPKPDSKLLIDPYTLGLWLMVGNINKGVIHKASEYDRIPYDCAKYGSVKVLRKRLRLEGILGKRFIPEKYFCEAQAILEGIRDCRYTRPNGELVISKKGYTELLQDIQFLLSSKGKPVKLLTTDKIIVSPTKIEKHIITECTKDIFKLMDYNKDKFYLTYNNILIEGENSEEES